MEIEIRRVERNGQDEWRVEACGMDVPFRDQASAISFADRLKERVEAPHCFPKEVLQRWAEEHARIQED